MIQKNIPRITVIILGTIIVLGAVSALAASNTVLPSRLDEQNTPIAIADKKPAACTMTITRVFACTGGACTGTVASELILGSANADTIKGKGGADCILGGDGNDDLIGNNGGDICFGGAGNDTFTKCETCTGGPGFDNFNDCGIIKDKELGELP